MNEPNELFISVDVETSGPIPGEFSLLSIGACAVDDPRHQFECLLKPISDKADSKALEVSGLSMEHLAIDGLEPRPAMENFEAWLKALAGDEDQLIFVGFNAPFDWSFVNYYFHRFLGRNPFGFTALDIKAFYMGKTGCSWRETRSSVMRQSLKPALAGNHDALRDALYQAEMFRLARSSA